MPDDPFELTESFSELAANGALRLYAGWVPLEYSIITLPDSVKADEPFSLRAVLKSGDQPVPGRELLFKVGGNLAGKAETDSSGQAAVSGLRVSGAGTYPVEVFYLADGQERGKGRAELVIQAAAAFPLGLVAAVIALAMGGVVLMAVKRSPRPPEPDHKKPASDQPDKAESDKAKPDQVESDQHLPISGLPGRFLQVDIPADGLRNTPNPLTLGLAKETTEFRESLSILKQLAPSGAESVQLNFKVTAPGYEQMYGHAAYESGNYPMTLHLTGEFEPIRFDLVPQLLGEQAIEVEVYYQGSRVDYSISTPNVVTPEQLAAASPGKAAQIRLESAPDHLKDLLAVAKEQPKALVIRTIQVDYQSQANQIIYRIYSGETADPLVFPIRLPNDPEEMYARIRVFTEYLDEIVPVEEAPAVDWENIYLNLVFRAQNLYRLLVPEDMARVIETWAEGSVLVISSNEQWIPWEVFHDGSDYWGRKFILGRYPRKADHGQVPRRDRPQGGQEFISRITNVIGGHFRDDTTAQKARELFRALPGVVVTRLIEETLADLVKVLPETDLLHLTCHGSVTHPMLEISGQSTDYMNLNLDVVQNLPVKAGCFIFANACYSNSAVSVFKILTSFGWEFYKDGAGIYIGTLAKIPEFYAGEFAHQFYQAMFAGNGSTVGQVLREVKLRMSSEQNIHWLMYSMYGDPIRSFRLKP